MEKNRLEFFSDGVIAIIITIMILEIKLPQHNSNFSSLIPMLPAFMSYVISFLYIGIYWGNHHHLLLTAEKASSAIMLANLHLLFWLSLIPVTTGWVGSSHFASDPVALYGAVLLMAGLAYFILQKTIERDQICNRKLFNAMKKHSYKGIISQITYAVGILVAYFLPFLSLLMYFGVSIMWLIPERDIELALK